MEKLIFILLLFVAIFCLFYKKFKRDKKTTIVALGAMFIWIFFLVNALSKYNKEQDESLREEMEWKSQCETVEGVEELINGTTWTFTEPITDDSHFKEWIKLEFNNGKVSQWIVSPSEGTWGEPEVFDYTVEKARYSNTGESYVRVIWCESSYEHYALVPLEKMFYGKYDRTGGELKNEDCNPWKD